MRPSDGAGLLLGLALALGFGWMGSGIVRDISQPMPAIIRAFQGPPAEKGGCIHPVAEILAGIPVATSSDPDSVEWLQIVAQSPMSPHVRTEPYRL